MPIITVTQAAKLISKDRNTVHRYIHKGIILKKKGGIDTNDLKIEFGVTDDKINELLEGNEKIKRIHTEENLVSLVDNLMNINNDLTLINKKLMTDIESEFSKINKKIELIIRILTSA